MVGWDRAGPEKFRSFTINNEGYRLWNHLGSNAALPPTSVTFTSMSHVPINNTDAGTHPLRVVWKTNRIIYVKPGTQEALRRC